MLWISNHFPLHAFQKCETYFSKKILTRVWIPSGWIVQYIGLAQMSEPAFALCSIAEIVIDRSRYCVFLLVNKIQPLLPSVVQFLSSRTNHVPLVRFVVIRTFLSHCVLGGIMCSRYTFDVPNSIPIMAFTPPSAHPIFIPTRQRIQRKGVK